jgi:hypothetical protein
MPISSVTVAVTAVPITIRRIHAKDQAQAIQQARDWAQHVLDTVEHVVALGEVLEAEEVGPEVGG